MKYNDKSVPRGKRKIERWQVIACLIMLYDVVVIHLAYLLALWLRFDCIFSRIPSDYLRNYQYFITAYSAVCVIVF